MDNEKTSKEARAKRLKMIRQMTGLNRNDFAKKYHLSFSNFQNWEGPRYGGLTEPAAKKILHACDTEGIHATLEWLMYGIGAGPKITELFYNKTNQNVAPIYSTTKDSEIYVVNREIAMFLQNKNEILEMLVTDDGMEPYYKSGEYVAGTFYTGDDLAKIINLNCIIKLPNESLTLRTLKAGSVNNLFTLVCINPQTKVTKPVIYDVPVEAAAPVMHTFKKYIHIF